MEKVLILRDKTDYPKEDGYYLVKWHEDYRGLRTDSYFDLERKWDHAGRKFIIGWYEEVELSSIKVAGETPKVDESKLSSSELDDYISARYEPMKQDFKDLWDSAKKEDGYIVFENWWSDYLKEKFEIAYEMCKNKNCPPTLQGDNPKR